MSKSKTIKKSEYDIYLDKLLNLIREKGTLVEVMPKGTSFLFNTRQEYKKMLGAVALNDKHGNVTNIYVAYEDFDGSIKYYDYPEYTRKEIKKKREVKNLKQHIRKGIEFLRQLLCLMFIELILLFCLFFLISWTLNMY